MLVLDVESTTEIPNLSLIVLNMGICSLALILESKTPSSDDRDKSQSSWGSLNKKLRESFLANLNFLLDVGGFVGVSSPCSSGSHFTTPRTRFLLDEVSRVLIVVGVLAGTSVSKQVECSPSRRLSGRVPKLFSLTKVSALKQVSHYQG